ncbi:MAG TPA: HAD family hydrolase, partial [Ideonella sp.]|nr:HAD family hydrolase [Ideonella sp.]
ARQVEAVLRVMREQGMTATVSSIHVNGWYGSHDKLSGARWIVRRLLRRELDAECRHWLYVGDSTNDQAMFAHFPLSVGVANLLDFADRLDTWPAWLAEGTRGAGFAEIAARLLAAR